MNTNPTHICFLCLKPLYRVHAASFVGYSPLAVCKTCSPAVYGEYSPSEVERCKANYDEWYPNTDGTLYPDNWEQYIDKAHKQGVRCAQCGEVH
jgi:hypothetical protein